MPKESPTRHLSGLALLSSPSGPSAPRCPRPGAGGATRAGLSPERGRGSAAAAAGRERGHGHDLPAGFGDIGGAPGAATAEGTPQHRARHLGTQ